ncbi:hypothetical protein EDM22_07600 [Agromyces tardus]|uniref:2-oxoacid dehydrogenase acyltransferase catalytic domain-containing protein n=1 Tax=Agromyces tardus TaxID=2583849 RepID=A0A3M8AGL9_9MICO|nr:2-oxo acid dehydrogenase subunit E2 [Agromyces tardus]RNB50356.1 hypothetical protein EDM22_07600 [Agromyces tardus]
MARVDANAVAAGPGYALSPVPRYRRPVLDRLTSASRRFQVHALVELDVSEAGARIAAADHRVSWTGFVIASLARAVARHPEVNARKAGARILTFDRVDLGVTVEREWQGRRILDVVTIRDADRTPCAEISRLLHEAKHGPPGGAPAPRGLTAAMLRLPGPLRRTAFRIAGRNPRVAASFGPAVGVTSLGMFSSGWAWAVPLAPLTVIATVGAVVDRAVVREDSIVARPMMPLTLSFDHAVIDGAPAARFTETFRSLVESAAAFDESPIDDGSADSGGPPVAPVSHSDAAPVAPLAFDLAVAIRRPPRAVFALLTDIQDAEPIPRDAVIRMVKDPPGPTVAGTRWHESVRIAPFSWFHVESVVTDVQPPHRLAMDFHSLWLTGHLAYEIEPVAGGCVLHHRETVRARVLRRWLQPLVERGMRPRLLRRLADIRSIVEETTEDAATETV